MRGLAACAASLALLLGCAAAPTPDTARPHQPEAASGVRQHSAVLVREQAVAAAHPLAADAGWRMLRAGGTAADAAIAAQLVLTLVEPQSSGIGGGAFLLHWDGQRLDAWDGRETAPAAADEGLFLDAQGRPLPFREAVVGGLSVGTPGLMRLLEAVHRAHGRLPWAQLFEPAIALADEGFAVGPRLHALLRSDEHLRRDPAAAAYFYGPDGAPHPVGHRLRNPALAAILRTLAREGADAFYRGPIARSIVAKVRNHPVRPGRLSEADLAAYQVRRREALCSPWRTWQVCGFPPPSSGHLAIAQILGLLEHVAPPAAARPAALPGPDFLHAYAEASRLAFADRAQYVADPDFVAPPAGHWSSLLAPAYLAERARLISPHAMPRARPGRPGGQHSVWAPQPEAPERGTSHLSVIDREGRAVAMTTTIEDAFGARQLVDGGTGLPGGFLLNNQLTDFAFVPTDAHGRPVANRVEPGKRPRSSMSPTLVFERAGGQLVLNVGSPGGAWIIHYTAKVLLGTLAWGLDAQQAIDQPNFGTTGGPLLLEEGRFPAATLEALRRRGHTVREAPMTSGAQALQRQPRGWLGAADPRREGAVRGQ
ncbi:MULTISPECIES: gamma-glutamyltransferase family protein [Caldimonas]|jgi:gamma-glutamyltranspeptidase/glutathione hydrolase|uniref:gamma-glutamyltransferase family protein n=1 Tax=Caldimonas TaxID=196013 RepID=UPI00037CB529|nr:gamma-glutamyltransferase family protein [Caldimonas manganoxidans]MCX7660720.1 gamma-glutamyltransferase family protein [Caldimonas manganoxidans]